MDCDLFKSCIRRVAERDSVMPNIGSLYKVKLSIFVKADTDEFDVGAFYLEEGNLISIVEMNSHFLVVLTPYGALRTPCFNVYVNPEEIFEKVI